MILIFGAYEGNAQVRMEDAHCCVGRVSAHIKFCLAQKEAAGQRRVFCSCASSFSMGTPILRVPE